MASFKLVYFDGRGRGELARLVLKAAAIPFEDVRLGYGSDAWPGEWKAKCPFGQLPVLFVDDKPLAQSTAMARYLAKEFHLAGKTAWEQARADMLVDEFGDIMTEAYKCMFESDETKKSELNDKFNNDMLPRHLGYLENLLKENNGGKSFFVGDSLTWADLGLVNVYDLLGSTDAPFAKTPLLTDLCKRVREIPNIAAWIKTRPQTPW